MLYMIYGVDADNAGDLRRQTREAHFKYLEVHEDIMVLGGATLADDGTTRTGSVLIVNVANRAAADAFSENEPFRKAGVFRSVTVTHMRRGQWFPDNAPSTEEGD